MIHTKREIVIGLMGLGTVGRQVYEALSHNSKWLNEKTGLRYRIKKILVQDPRKPRPVKVPLELLTTDPSQVIEDPEIQLVVEVIGGLHPAAEYIEASLGNRKSVVTANKGVMATHGEKLLKLASDQRVDLFFEASVAGAIPILRPLQESMAMDRIMEVSGIVNGTTNYILTQMTHSGATYETALKDAQRLGYAEPDPTFDVTGMDAAYKIAILAALGFGCFAKGEHVHREGITNISTVDIQQVKELGYRIKLMAKAELVDEGLSLRVSPSLMPPHHPLFNVEGPYNAILVRGERLGDIMFYGQGAGGIPTSTAVVSDLVHAANSLVLGTGGKSIPTINHKIKPISIENLQSRFYFRLQVEDKPGTLAALAQIFAEEKVSFSAVLQKENPASVTDIVFLTHKAPEGRFRKALERVKQLLFVKSICSTFRVES